MVSAADVRRIPVFEPLTDEQAAWIADHLEERRWAEDDVVFERGAAAEHLIVVFEGVLQIVAYEGGQRHVFATLEAGAVSGLLPYSRMTHYSGEGIALEPVRLGQLHKEHFPEMLRRMPELGQRLVGLLSDRVRMSMREQQQRERMMALGRLSAGLAHELNNPAAAVRRAAATLRERVDAMPPLVAALAAQAVSEAQVRRAAAVCTAEACVPPPASALERSEREDALADWLDAHDVGDGYVLAGALVDAGVTPDALDDLAGRMPAASVPAVVAWLENRLATDRLLLELEDAAGRISELVASVKAYTHMDRGADRRPTDVVAGLDSTVTMLGHKLREKDVHVERAFADDLPQPEAHPGQLNQVWTNLIDNAVDAMAPGGTLRLEAAEEGPYLCVRVIDDGPGISDDLQARIFEPFFTTKDVGEGTGMGLEIARRLIVEGHHGDIEVASRPGRTVFTVRLPLDGG